MSPLVVLPTYQEAENVRDVLTRVRAAVPDAHVLIVGDSSAKAYGGDPPDGREGRQPDHRDELQPGFRDREGRQSRRQSGDHCVMG